MGLDRKSIIIRRSPAVFVRTIVAVELGALVLFLAVRPLAFYKELYNAYVYQSIIPFRYDAVFMAAVTAFEVMLTIYVFLRWYTESYRMDTLKIVHERGTVFRRYTRVLFERAASADFRVGFMGSMFGYGTVRIRHADPKGELLLRDVPTPKKYADIISRFIRKQQSGVPARTFDAQDIESILGSREHEHIEFKGTLRWDQRLGRVNREIERVAMKTVSAFLNSEGGCLVIGVDDGGDIIGLADDYRTIQRQDADGFENHFTQVFCSMIGPEFRSFVRLRFHTRSHGEICVVEVLPAEKPAYIAYDGKEEFFVRTGNTTTSLRLREAHAYIRSRWGSV